MRYIKNLLIIGLLSEQLIFSIFDDNCLRNCCLWAFFCKQRTTKENGDAIDRGLVVKYTDKMRVLRGSLQNVPVVVSVLDNQERLPMHWPDDVGGVLKEPGLSPNKVSQTDSWDSAREVVSSGNFRHVESDVAIESPTAKSKTPVHRITSGSESFDNIDEHAI